MSRTDPLLTVRSLAKSFGANRVLESVDLDVPAGTVTTLIGPSGSGKTTLLRCLNGLEVPDVGTVAVAGGPTIDFGGSVSRRTIGELRDCSAMVFQHYNLF